MGTQAAIAVHLEDGTVRNVTVHWDGYLLGVGKSLLESHNSLQAANALVDLGDLSYVEGASVCAYSRDRGDSWESCRPVDFLSITEWDSSINVYYRYIYMDNAWFFSEKPYGSSSSVVGVVPLSDAVAQAELEDR